MRSDASGRTACDGRPLSSSLADEPGRGPRSRRGTEARAGAGADRRLRRRVRAPALGHRRRRGLHAAGARREGVASPKSSRRGSRSDLLLVKPVGAQDWLQFRDVYEVNGVAVHDRSDRLDEAVRGSDRVRRTRGCGPSSSESARFNIGSVDRTMNVPLLPLRFLEAEEPVALQVQAGRQLETRRRRGTAAIGPGRAFASRPRSGRFSTRSASPAPSSERRVFATSLRKADSGSTRPTARC